MIKRIWFAVWSWVKPYWTRKMIPFLLIAWVITNGWCYVFIALGPVLGLPWMTKVGAFWAAILWMPWSLEKPLLTLPLAGLLYRVSYKEKFIKEDPDNGKVQDEEKGWKER